MTGQFCKLKFARRLPSSRRRPEGDNESGDLQTPSRMPVCHPGGTVRFRLTLPMVAIIPPRQVSVLVILEMKRRL